MKPCIKKTQTNKRTASVEAGGFLLFTSTLSSYEFENDTSAAKGPGELDWMFHVDIAGPTQIVCVYAGLVMKAQYRSLNSYPECFAALNSFMNILDEVNKNVSAGQGAMNNLSQLEKSYLRERKLCEEELH